MAEFITPAVDRLRKRFTRRTGSPTRKGTVVPKQLVRGGAKGLSELKKRGLGIRTQEGFNLPTRASVLEPKGPRGFPATGAPPVQIDPGPTNLPRTGLPQAGRAQLRAKQRRTERFAQLEQPQVPGAPQAPGAPGEFAAIQPQLAELQRIQQGRISAETGRVAGLDERGQTQIGSLESTAARQKEALAARFEEQRRQIGQVQKQASEDTATRFAFSGFGRSTEQIGAQTELAQQTQNLLNEVNRAQALEEQLIDAQLSGASGEILADINREKQLAQNNAAQLQSDLVERQGQLRLGAVEAGQTQSQLQLQQQLDQENQRLEFLQSQGLTVDPSTGETVADIAFVVDQLNNLAQGEQRQASAEKSRGFGFGSQLLGPGREQLITRTNPITGEVEAVPIGFQGETLRAPAPRGRGGGGIGGVGIPGGPTNQFVDERRALGLTDDQILAEAEANFPGTSKAAAGFKRGIVDFLNATTQDTLPGEALPTVGPNALLRSFGSGFQFPEARTGARRRFTLAAPKTPTFQLNTGGDAEAILNSIL